MEQKTTPVRPANDAHLPMKASVVHPEYIAIVLAELHVDAVIDCTIFIMVGEEKYVKYRESGMPFDEGVRRRLVDNKHSHIYIHRDETGAFASYLETNLKYVIRESRIPSDEKAKILYDTTTHIVKDILSDPRSKEEIRRSSGLVESALEYVFASPSSLGQVIDMISHDYYTYTHSVNVMTYSLALSRRMGYKSQADILNIGQAALLHDIGKTFIKPEIVQKAGPLNPDEFTEMQRHPTYGYLSLNSTGELPNNVLMAVRHHHEDLKGKGYPHGLSDDQIPMEIRIITCVDIYDALTTRRSYRSAFKTFPALKMMKEWTGTKIDTQVFAAFVKMLGEVS